MSSLRAIFILNDIAELFSYCPKSPFLRPYLIIEVSPFSLGD